jgi:signal transduction histidine kinase
MRWFVIPKMAISLPLAVLAAAILIFINEAGFRLSTQAATSIEAAQETRSAVNKLLQHMLDAETGQRGYLLTGDPKYLVPYDEATSDLNQTLNTLRRLYTPYQEELAEFGELSRNVSRKLAEMDLSVRMRKQGNEEAWKFVLTTDVGMEQMNAIRSQIVKLIQSSDLKMRAAQAQITRSLQLSRLGIALMALAGLLAFYMYLRQTRALLNAGRREQASLQRERDQLDKEVRDRTATLAELATHLQQVREDERGHLARELHDELGANLTAINIDLNAVADRLRQSEPALAAMLDRARATLVDTVELKRRIVEDLRPSLLDNMGLAAAVLSYCGQYQRLTGIDCEALVDDAVDAAGPMQAIALFRIMQESLNNIAKYAQAKNVIVHLVREDDILALEVTDDGIGIDESAVSKPKSHGLLGMRERALLLGGTLKIRRGTNDRGTCIEALIPVCDPAHDAAGAGAQGRPPVLSVLMSTQRTQVLASVDGGNA